MFRFIKKVLILVLISPANYLKCISLKNQECKVSKVCVPDIIKNVTVKMFDLITLTNNKTSNFS